MRWFLRLALLFLCGTGPLGAQGGWSIATSVPWPLLDVGVLRDTADLVRITTAPLQSTAKSLGPARPPRVPLRMLQVSRSNLRIWIAAGRRVLDSVEALPRNDKAVPQGHVLPGTQGQESIAFAFDLREKADKRYLLRLSDTLGNTLWNAYAGRKESLALFAVLDSVIGQPARPPWHQNVECEGLVLPKVIAPIPKIDLDRSGIVSLSFVVDTSGVVVDSSVTVELISAPSFLKAAQQFVKKVRYLPARCPSGGPVPLLSVQNIVRSEPVVTRTIIRR